MSADGLSTNRAASPSVSSEPANETAPRATNTCASEAAGTGTVAPARKCPTDNDAPGQTNATVASTTLDATTTSPSPSNAETPAVAYDAGWSASGMSHICR